MLAIPDTEVFLETEGGTIFILKILELTEPVILSKYNMYLVL